MTWVKISEKTYLWKKLYLEPCSCTSKNGKYLGSINDNSAIICDELEKWQKPFQRKLFKQIPIFYSTVYEVGYHY